MPVDPKQFKKDLEDLNKLYRQLERKALSASDFSKGAEGAKQMAIYLREAKTEVAILNTSFKDTANWIGEIAEEWSTGFVKPLKEGTKSFRVLRGLASDLEDDLHGVIDLEKKQLLNIKKKAEQEKENHNRIKENLEKKKRDGKELNTEEQSLLANLTADVKVTTVIISQAKKRLEQERKIAKTAGVTGAIFNSLSSTLGKVGIGSEFFEDGKKNIREAAKSGSKLKVVGAGISSLFKGIGEALMDPVVIFGLLTTAFTSLLALGQKFAQYTADIGKAFLGMGADSKTVADNLKNMAAGSEGLYMNFEEAKKALIGLNKVAGTSVEFSEAQIKNYQKLTHFLGLSEEAAQGLFKTSLLSGSGFEDVASEIGGVVAGLNQSNGLSLNLNDVLEEVSKASSTTRFNVGQTSRALAAAAFEAKRLGMTLDQISSAAESTLDFESSIANEIKAELLLGKDLNLEKLRYEALTGDTNTQAKELNRLLAENVESTEGNVIKQKALADSLGMSVEDMLKANDARILQNELSKRGITDRVKAEKALAILRSKGLTQEQALEKLAKGKLDAIVEEGKKAETSMRMLENAKETLMVSIAPLADKIAKLVQSFAESGALKSMLKTIGGVLKWIGENPKTFLGIGALAGGAMFAGKALAGKLGTERNPMVVKFAEKVIGGLKSIFKGKKGKPSMIAKGLQKLNPMNWGKKMGKSGLYKKSSKGIISKTLGKVSKSVVPKVAGKNIAKIGAKLGAKAMGKSLLKRIPGLGALAGVGFAIDRVAKGDMVGAAMELASGGASLLDLVAPGAGLTAGLAMDAAIAARDIHKATSEGEGIASDFISRPGQPIQKFRADDVIVGGTNLNGGGNRVEQLLERLVVAVESGGDVYIDGAKAGRSLVLAASQMG